MSKRMLVFPFLLLFISVNAEAEDLPAIYLERIASDEGAIARALKLNYDQCVSSKKILKQIKREMGQESVAWQAAQETYDQKIIANADFSPFPEPDWTKLKPRRVEEYFDQEKFTRRTYITRYRIDLARCELKDREDLTLRIDNGEREVRIDFKGKKKNIASVAGVNVPIHASHYKSYKVKQRPSPRVSRDQLLANQENLRSMPGELQRLADQLRIPSDATAPPGPGGLALPGKKESDFLEETFNLEQQKYIEPNYGPGHPRQGSEQIIAGQTCDMTKLGKLDSKLCLWHKMNRYPDEYGAEVILLKESGLGNHKLVEEAIEFKLMGHIKPEVFQLPPGVKM